MEMVERGRRIVLQTVKSSKYVHHLGRKMKSVENKFGICHQSNGPTQDKCETRPMEN